ncbi:uncharacterized protein si:zfos-905g2.1 isoform X1 [Clupea harengus]|uniref:Uncharacterized protein si:zfos-905g2.1 isoform X1 n=1 Tax=Clupea harengus TaxID=7950 RepID=A0A6P3VMN6_CLUHA|nr:uncharacterized protein si:zfos-905g2.1 isoform X1 [Clupea harengus]
MKVECENTQDKTNVTCHRGRVGCAENAEGMEPGMSEVIVQLEDEQYLSSPETCSSPETDMFLFAPISDTEESADYDSDSSGVPTGKQHCMLRSNVEGNKLKEYTKTEDNEHSSLPAENALAQKINYVIPKNAVENGVLPRTDRKPRRKKTNSPLPKESSSSSSKDQSKRHGRKKSPLKMQPYKSDKSLQDCRMSGETAGWIPAPYTKTETAISPQTAMEPPGFPSVQAKIEEPFFDKKDNVLLEVLKYCQTLCTAVQRLEQKVDSLQAECSKLYLHVNKENSKEEWHSSTQRLEFELADPNSHAPTLSRRQSDKRHTLPFWDRDQPPWRQGQLNVSARTENNCQCLLPSNEETDTNRLDSSQPDANLEEADKTSMSKIAGRGRGRGGGGGRRGRGQSKGRSQTTNKQKDPHLSKVPPVRANQPKRRAASAVPNDQGPCASKVAKILSKLQERRLAAGGPVDEGCEATTNTSASEKGEQQVMIGSAFRKVCIPYSVYMEAFKLDEPQRAVVPVLHAVFPLSVLTCSAVVGNPQRGIQELNPNKLEAIREWLAEMYPRHELEVKGKAWAECLGILNSITKTLKTDTTPAKKSSPKVP